MFFLYCFAGISVGDLRAAVDYYRAISTYFEPKGKYVSQ